MEIGQIIDTYYEKEGGGFYKILDQKSVNRLIIILIHKNNEGYKWEEESSDIFVIHLDEKVVKIKKSFIYYSYQGPSGMAVFGSMVGETRKNKKNFFTEIRAVEVKKNWLGANVVVAVLSCQDDRIQKIKLRL